MTVGSTISDGGSGADVYCGAGGGTDVYCGIGVLREAGKSRCDMVIIGLYVAGAVGIVGPSGPNCRLSSESGLCGLDGGIALVEAYSGGESSVKSLSETNPRSISSNGVPNRDGVCDVVVDVARAVKRPHSSLGWFHLAGRLACW